MDSSQQPTINENPTILAVDTRRLKQQQPPLPNVAAPTTVADWAVRQALIEAAATAAAGNHGNNKGLTLLANLGVTLPTNDGTSASIPFVYAPSRWRAGETKTENKACTADDNTAATPNTTSNNDDDDADNNTPLDVDDVFEIIRNIQDPEHPLTLEQLGVVSRDQIVWQPANHDGAPQRLEVRFTPTIPHCSMATQIGLCLRVKLDRSLPTTAGIKTTVKIEPGTHASEMAINKQLADKERVCAALENKHLLGIVNRCIRNGMTGNME